MEYSERGWRIYVVESWEDVKVWWGGRNFLREVFYRCKLSVGAESWIMLKGSRFVLSRDEEKLHGLGYSCLGSDELRQKNKEGLR